jgi:hypothetical protein
MKFLCFVLVLVVSHAAADLVPVAVSSSIDVGGGEAVVEAVSVANAVSNAAADNLTAWAWRDIRRLSGGRNRRTTNPFLLTKAKTTSPARAAQAAAARPGAAASMAT